MTKPYYITTPLYYVNARPHIGHAYTNILCDTFARFRRFLGEEVFFMTGTDEHGTKIDKAAREQGVSPKTYADEMVPEFKALWKLLGIQYDYFIRTTDSQHEQVVQNILRHLDRNGTVVRARYVGSYCTPCESFWTQLQLVEGKCPDCRREVQELSEENYFFKLSENQSWLIRYIQEHPEFIRPEIRANEILGSLKEPLEDLCITRPRARLGWGIDYPGSKDHVVYVWFDALVNYLSGIGYSTDERRFSTLWPADVHMVGKDILRHHAIYWPLILKAIGVPMPRTILAHGWWTMAGAKVSKSRGNTVDPVELIRRYGVDAFRYFLLREVTLGLDGAFSEDLLAERYTSDLANDLGNLWFRMASMLDRYFEGKVPGFKDSYLRIPLLSETIQLWDRVQRAMFAYDPRGALADLWGVITQANRFVEESKPWRLAKEAGRHDELEQVLAVLAECLARLACLLQSFLPETARSMLSRFKLPTNWNIPAHVYADKPLLKTGARVERGDPLFPRLEES